MSTPFFSPTLAASSVRGHGLQKPVLLHDKNDPNSARLTGPSALKEGRLSQLLDRE